MLNWIFLKTYYSSTEYFPETKNYDDVFRIKIGLDYNLSILAVGLETKYQRDFNKKDFVVTPKIGFGFNYVNLHYGLIFRPTKIFFQVLGIINFR